MVGWPETGYGSRRQSGNHTIYGLNRVNEFDDEKSWSPCSSFDCKAAIIQKVHSDYQVRLKCVKTEDPGAVRPGCEHRD